MKSLRYYSLLAFALSLPIGVGAADFGDIPASLALPAGTSVRRNAGNTAFESYIPGTGSATAFTDLTDVPNSYSGQGLKAVRVNAAANALEFYTPSGGGGTWGSITGTLSDQTDLQTALDAKVPNTRTVNGHALSADVTVSASDVGLGSVTNDAQTKAAVVPNTAPSAGQILVGNAGGTAYAKQTLSGSGATLSLASTGVATISGIANASLSNSAITIAGSSISLGGSISLDTISGVSSNGFLKRTSANTWTNDSSTYITGNQTIALSGDVTGSGATAITTTQRRAVTLVVDGGGTVLTTGTKNPIKVNYGGTLQAWTIMCKPSGSVTVDIFRAADGGGLPTSSIVGGGGTKPAVSSGVENSSTSFTSWTSTTLTAKDNLAISLSGVSTSTYCALTLYYQ